MAGSNPLNLRPMRVSFKFDHSVVMYLVIPDIYKFKDILRARPIEQFQDMVYKEVMNYVAEEQEPPAQISTAIMNVADDMMDRRDVALRSGDYIDLMNYAKEQNLLYLHKSSAFRDANSC